jgi:hypothetical protein
MLDGDKAFEFGDTWREAAVPPLHRHRGSSAPGPKQLCPWVATSSNDEIVPHKDLS